MRATTALLVSAIGIVSLGATWNPRAAVLYGVVSDASGAPMTGAEVSLPALQLSALTNDSGKFRFAEVPAGSHEMRVRRVGFLEFTSLVDVPASGAVERNVTLRPVQTLTPIEVTADAGLREFEENRRIGFGKFMTRAELEKQEHRKLPEILEAVGVKSYKIGLNAWVGASRAVRSMGLAANGRMAQCPELEGKRVRQEDRNKPDKDPGCGCWAQVWMDDILLYNGDERGVVPDINRIMASSLEAVEYYKSAAQTPMKYSRLNSQCGVLVLHTRRTPAKAKQPE